jgi:hypothetical protein
LGETVLRCAFGGTHSARLGQWISLPSLANRTLRLAGPTNLACDVPFMVAPLTAGVVLGLMNSYQAFSAFAGFVMTMAGRTVSQDRSAT